MEKKIKIKDEVYLVTNDQMIGIDEELVFELKNNNSKTSYVIGLFDDLLGAPVKKVWKILEHIK